MFTGEDLDIPQPFAAQNSPYMDQTELFQVGKNRNFPFHQSPNLGAKPTYDLHCLNTAQQNVLVGGQPPPYYSAIPFLSNDFKSYDAHFLSTAQRTGLGGGLFKSDLPCGYGVHSNTVNHPPQKRFLIFDQSKDRTRLFLGPSLLPQLDQTTTSKPPTDGYSKRVEAQMDQHFFVNEEKWDENKLIDGEGEMREDTEEINALLYSDSSDGDYDSDNDEDEVVSPIVVPSMSKDKVHNEEDFIEEVASSDVSRKRQRLLDGSYNHSSFVSVGARTKRLSTSCSSEDDMESKCVLPKSKKVKIDEALQVLSRMIPGLKGKNPLSVIDDSIRYLESIKLEAEALKLGCYAESKLPSST